ncbi:tripartite tricarboxylate transporter substrate binding protein [Acuticoccus sp. M5D2P5]|uniref:Bug family tripartite tricarboxylate transporter substrate binding protein n=1 Tax=Acuticoccus kalidii TaxID=2910977 RepID=UPI001F417DB8|nr:tripartite tricarboxylate transporter substrate binding protein [Acuticoccus kalidii]MCF3933393.1 tripartite tricarboxylate transporter substrate binding protein [Acuticoccus kalidii]
MNLRRSILSGLAATAVALTLSSPSPVLAQDDYPTKAVDWVVMWRAGGGADSASRTFIERLEPILGEDIVVKNITGGGGGIGYMAAKTAKADGYTLVTIQGDLPKFEPMGLAPIALADFDIIAGYAFQSPMIVVSADSPYETLDAFVAAAKDAPGSISVGTTDIGGVFHQPLVLFEDAAGIETRAVALEGSSQQTVNLLGGNTDAAVTWVKATAPYVEEGKLRYLAYMASERHPDFPDIPTVSELGYDVVWEHPYGVGAPAGIPDAAKAKIEAAAKEIWEDPSFQEKLDQQGLTVLRMGSADYTEHMKKMQADMEKAIGLIQQ